MVRKHAYPFDLELFVTTERSFRSIGGRLPKVVLEQIADTVKQKFGLKVDLTVSSQGKTQVKWGVPSIDTKVLIRGSAILTEENDVFHVSTSMDIYFDGEYIGQAEDVQFISAEPTTNPTKNRLFLVRKETGNRHL